MLHRQHKKDELKGGILISSTYFAILFALVVNCNTDFHVANLKKQKKSMITILHQLSAVFASVLGVLQNCLLFLYLSVPLQKCYFSNN